MKGSYKGNYIAVRRTTILGLIMTGFLLVDGLVLLLTNGLTMDAGPLFPWLGGSFNSNRSSGAGLLVIAAIALVVMAVGWFAYGRKVRAEYQESLKGAGMNPATPAGRTGSGGR